MYDLTTGSLSAPNLLNMLRIDPPGTYLEGTIRKEIKRDEERKRERENALHKDLDDVSFSFGSEELDNVFVLQFLHDLDLVLDRRQTLLLHC